MSHHTGAQFTTLPFQMIELMKKLREAKAVHIVKRHVPVFHASRCQGKGTKAKTTVMKENAEKT